MIYKFFKRVMDLIISIFALIILSPVLIPCIVILLCTGEHEIWYFQKRIGKEAKLFSIYKFATMLKKSEKMSLGTITVRNDPRVLPFGAFLRKTKINELPQIFNVLLGSMSVIGPRPLVKSEFDAYSLEQQKEIAKMKPGITGIGSVVFRDEEKYTSAAQDPREFYSTKIQPYKGALEVWYSQHASLCMDIKLVFLTAWVIVSPTSNLPHKLLKDLPGKPEWMK